MPGTSSPLDQPVERSCGVSGRRERLWGLVGGLVGSLVGIGSFVIAWLVQGATLGELTDAPYPPFFARRAIMPLDYYFLVLALLGLAFLGVALVSLRTGRYPRTDGYGAALLGSILSTLGGIVLFLRVWAIAHG